MEDFIAEKVWNAVESAVLAGWSPERLKKEVAECWGAAMRDEAKRGEKVLNPLPK